jgi:nucleoside-diphosphate-sugar epimerase
MKIGVTGATGFVGTALCNRLLQADHTVVKLVRKGTGPNVVAVGDIGPTTDWSAALAGCDVLVHLAARVHVMRETAADPQAQFNRVNAEGTAQLAQAAIRAGVGRFIYMSTAKVHGESTSLGKPYTEQDAPSPRDAYASSKLAAESALRRAAENSPMDWVIIRPPLVYGPGVKANFASLAQAIARGLPLPLAAIQNQRSMVSVDNLVDFVMCCLSHPRAVNQQFLISDGHDLSTPELARQLTRAAGRPSRLVYLPVPLLKLGANLMGKGAAIQRLSDNLQIDIGKAQTLLGWKPVVTVNQAITSMLNATKNP